MSNLHDEFLVDENFTLISPGKDKFIKIIHDDYKFSYDDESMVLTVSKKTTLEALAFSMGMSVDELIDSLERSL